MEVVIQARTKILSLYCLSPGKSRTSHRYSLASDVHRRQAAEHSASATSELLLYDQLATAVSDQLYMLLRATRRLWTEFRAVRSITSHVTSITAPRTAKRIASGRQRSLARRGLLRDQHQHRRSSHQLRLSGERVRCGCHGDGRCRSRMRADSRMQRLQ